jgi:hypothetical protein
MTATRHRNIFPKLQFFPSCSFVSAFGKITAWELQMNGLIYLIGLIVVIMAVLSLLGLR